MIKRCSKFIVNVFIFQVLMFSTNSAFGMDYCNNIPKETFSSEDDNSGNINPNQFNDNFLNNNHNLFNDNVWNINSNPLNDNGGKINSNQFNDNSSNINYNQSNNGGKINSSKIIQNNKLGEKQNNEKKYFKENSSNRLPHINENDSVILNISHINKNSNNDILNSRINKNSDDKNGKENSDIDINNVIEDNKKECNDDNDYEDGEEEYEESLKECDDDSDYEDREEEYKESLGKCDDDSDHEDGEEKYEESLEECDDDSDHEDCEEEYKESLEECDDDSDKHSKMKTKKTNRKCSIKNFSMMLEWQKKNVARSLRVRLFIDYLEYVLDKVNKLLFNSNLKDSDLKTIGLSYNDTRGQKSKESEIAKFLSPRGMKGMNANLYVRNNAVMKLIFNNIFANLMITQKWKKNQMEDYNKKIVEYVVRNKNNNKYFKEIYNILGKKVNSFYDEFLESQWFKNSILKLGKIKERCKEYIDLYEKEAKNLKEYIINYKSSEKNLDVIKNKKYFKYVKYKSIKDLENEILKNKVGVSNKNQQNNYSNEECKKNRKCRSTSERIKANGEVRMKDALISGIFLEFIKYIVDKINTIIFNSGFKYANCDKSVKRFRKAKSNDPVRLAQPAGMAKISNSKRIIKLIFDNILANLIMAKNKKPTGNYNEKVIRYIIKNKKDNSNFDSKGKFKEICKILGENVSSLYDDFLKSQWFDKKIKDLKDEGHDEEYIEMYKNIAGKLKEHIENYKPTTHMRDMRVSKKHDKYAEDYVKYKNIADWKKEILENEIGDSNENQQKNYSDKECEKMNKEKCKNINEYDDDKDGDYSDDDNDENYSVKKANKKKILGKKRKNK